MAELLDMLVATGHNRVHTLHAHPVPDPTDLGSQKRSFRGGSGLAPAAEDQAAEGEAEAESPDGDAAARERLAPRGEAEPASQGLALLLRQRLSPALLADRTARSQTEVE